MPRWKKWIFIAAGCLSGAVYFFSLPEPLFTTPFSTVLIDQRGYLLGANIAADGQWRFPAEARVPEKFRTALILFEDKRFYSHPGVDVLALARAARQNIVSGRIVSGGSTLSMQVIRLARARPGRSIWNKITEVVLATRLELRYSKSEILDLFAAHAPFGGNTVGIEAACWRYFGREPSELSWAEAALLAVLPNNPSWMHLARNRDKLRTKRDRLLKVLFENKSIDSLTYILALDEAIPEQPLPIPRIAPHLLERVAKDGYKGTRVSSTIDLHLQRETARLLQQHVERLEGNQIHNGAVLVVRVSTGEVLAYIGNATTGADHQQEVDVIRAPRSAGSILKPILFAAMLDEGKMLTKTLQPDIPTLINGYSPRNFSKQYDGAVPAHQALIRSLNVPAVLQLRDYRYEKFYHLLKNVGITTLGQPADHYGLSIILGGAEATLFDITGVYASMARTLNNYFILPGKNRYFKSDFRAPSYLRNTTPPVYVMPEATSFFSAGAIYLTFDVMKELYRPGEETGWRYFNSTKPIAWKTGTSFGFRDAWAVGINGEYAVGVWVGNADGEGRPGLTGTEAAAPLLFNIFSQLPGRAWFKVPAGELSEVDVCSASGHRATEKCIATSKARVTRKGLQTKPCPYHQWVFLSLNSSYRVNTSCAAPNEIRRHPWFVLPPAMEYFYRGKNLAYRVLPPLHPACVDEAGINMEVIYPREASKIYIPRELDGTLGSTVFQVAHREKDAKVYWHLDGEFVAVTEQSHRLSMTPKQGSHVLTVLDDKGKSITRRFTVVDQRR